MRKKLDAMHDEYGWSTKPCGDCCNLERRQCGNTAVFKCAAYGNTGSNATDWKANQLGCGLHGTRFAGIRPRRRPLFDALRSANKRKPYDYDPSQIMFDTADALNNPGPSCATCTIGAKTQDEYPGSCPFYKNARAHCGNYTASMARMDTEV